MPAPQRAKRADIYPQNLSASNISKAWKINSPFFQALEKERKIFQPSLRDGQLGCQSLNGVSGLGLAGQVEDVLLPNPPLLIHLRFVSLDDCSGGLWPPAATTGRRYSPYGWRLLST
jgi:hypothetical protein